LVHSQNVVKYLHTIKPLNSIYINNSTYIPGEGDDEIVGSSTKCRNRYLCIML